MPPNTACSNVPIKGKNDQIIILLFSFSNENTNKAIDIAEKDFQGLIIGNQAPNFSVGANIGMILLMAAEQ